MAEINLSIEFISVKTGVVTDIPKPVCLKTDPPADIESQ